MIINLLRSFTARETTRTLDDTACESKRRIGNWDDNVVRHPAILSTLGVPYAASDETQCYPLAQNYLSPASRSPAVQHLLTHPSTPSRSPGERDSTDPKCRSNIAMDDTSYQSIRVPVIALPSQQNPGQRIPKYTQSQEPQFTLEIEQIRDAEGSNITVDNGTQVSTNTCPRVLVV